MKRALIGFGVFAVVAALLFTFWPQARTTGRSLLDVIPGLLGRKDTVALARLERSRDSLDLALRSSDSAYLSKIQAIRDSLTAAQSRANSAALVTYRLKAKADSIARLLTKAREDDDSLPILVTLVRAKDSVIVAVMGERDAARGLVVILERAVEARDTQLDAVNSSLREAIRQRDAYRKRGKRDWLTAAVLVGGTMAVCSATTVC